MRFGHLPQFQTGDAFLVERSVKRVGSQMIMRFEPKRYALKTPKRADGLDGAANVPHAHAVNRLAEQHETASYLSLFLRIAAPCSWADSTRREVNENAVVCCQCATKDAELFRIRFEKRTPLRRVGFHFVRKRVAHPCNPFVPVFSVLHNEHDALGFFEVRAPRQK